MRSYKIQVEQKVKVPHSVLTAVRNAVNETLRHEGARARSSVNLLLTDDEQLRQLNYAYRNLDETTDVLSFPSGDELPGMGGDLHLGDIAVSVPYAERQAYEGQHSLKSELQLLAVHGTLHLLGYDHETPDDKMVMWAAQASVLAQVGAEITAPPESDSGEG